ncbi:MAG: hypothetical protein DRJ51_02910 [Thermoprotei archaeon]|nr:MAG: hypothetical protein DRJ51_02910 [Thermoprotei archaeon]
MYCFIVLSGEHDTLPYAEVISLLQDNLMLKDIAGKKNVFFYDQVIRANITPQECKEVVEKCAFAHYGCLEIISSSQNLREIVEKLSEVSWKEFINKKVISVRVIRMKEYGLHIQVPVLEKHIVSSIKESIGDLRIDYKKPSIKLVGILTEDRFLLGKLIAQSSRKALERRRPGQRPFFHPSALDSKLARFMLNACKVKEGDVILDPFCGTGTIPLEAEHLGARALGVDVNLELIKGALINIQYLSKEKGAIIDLLCSDIFLLPLRKIKGVKVVTDPPYGRVASTHGRNVNEIYAVFFKLLVNNIRAQRVVMLSPHWIPLKDFIYKCNLRIVEQHALRVHGGLTRKVTVIENPDIPR